MLRALLFAVLCASAAAIHAQGDTETPRAIPVTYTLSANAALLVVGAALCCAGWMAYGLGVRILGATVGLGFGFLLGLALIVVLRPGPEGDPLVLLGASLAGALMGLFVMKAISTGLIAVLGALMGLLLARVGLEMWATSNGVPFAWNNNAVLIVLGAGTFAALLSVWGKRFLIIVVTSLSGATMIATGAGIRNADHALALAGLVVGAIVWQVLLSRTLGRGGRARRDD